ncbi:MAG: sigma-70 family RNA polymerase sigma factor [Planctomycetota bacterium]
MDRDESALIPRLRRGELAAVGDAFQAHGRMVYNVCLRTLGNPAEAEDASQAAFLLLLQKRNALNENTALAGWLFRAAELVSRAALRTRLRRQRHEREAAHMMPTRDEGGSTAAWEDIRPRLDGALAALPEKWRSPIVLSYLEGKNREEAARTLGIPERTFYHRLEKGLGALRKRLGKENTVSTPALIAMLSERAGEAALPETLAASVMKAASDAAAGPSASIILEEALKMTLRSQIKIGATLAAAAALTATVTFPVAGYFAGKSRSDRAGTPAESRVSNPPVVARETRDHDTLRALERENAALLARREAFDAEAAASAIAMTPAPAIPAEAPARPAPVDETEAILEKMDWDDIAKAILEADVEDTMEITPKIVMRMMRHAGAIATLTKNLGLPDMYSLFQHEKVLAHLLPAYLRAGGIPLSDNQTGDLVRLTEDAHRRRTELANSELPAHDFLLLQNDFSRKAADILGKPAFEKFPALAWYTELASIGKTELTDNILNAATMRENPARFVKTVRDSLASKYELDPSQCPILESVALDIVNRLTALPPISGDQIQRGSRTSAFIEISRDAARSLLASGQIPPEKIPLFKTRVGIFCHIGNNP